MKFMSLIAILSLISASAYAHSGGEIQDVIQAQGGVKTIADGSVAVVGGTNPVYVLKVVNGQALVVQSNQALWVNATSLANASTVVALHAPSEYTRLLVAIRVNGRVNGYKLYSVLGLASTEKGKRRFVATSNAKVFEIGMLEGANGPEASDAFGIRSNETPQEAIARINMFYSDVPGFTPFPLEASVNTSTVGLRMNMSMVQAQADARLQKGLTCAANLER